MIRFWDEFSSEYSAEQQGDIPIRIVQRLMDVGILQSDDKVLEIGPGPGTYSVHIAENVESLTCIDSSQRMLDQLISKAGALGLTNIEFVCKDWELFQSRKDYDLCISTLCPGTGSPASITRMETASKRACALVSWSVNHGDDLNEEIWHRLGKDYGYGSRKSTVVQDWLRDNERDPVVEYFNVRVEKDIPVEDLIRKEKSAFRPYGITEGIDEMVMDILSSELEDGVIHYSAVNVMKLIYWDTQTNPM